MDDVFNRIPEIFSKIDALYISSKFIDVINEQSCDCDELIISNDNHFFKQHIALQMMKMHTLYLKRLIALTEANIHMRLL